MNCETVQAGNLAEKYVLGQLAEPEQSAFEEHFFVCGACVAEVRTLQAIQGAGGKAGPGMGWRVIWFGVAAALVVGFGLMGASYLWNKAPRTAQPASAARRSADASAAILALARAEAPRYTASTLRGTADPAAQQFRNAMKSYSAGDYAAAAEGLKAAARGNAPGPRFYLGVCELLTGRADEAVAELRAVAGLGDTPYLEQARFFLAKALLAKRDRAGASKELELTIQLAGDRAAEARQLLDQVRALPAVE